MSAESNRRGALAHEVAGLSREEAITLAEAAFERQALDPEQTVGCVVAYRRALVDLLTALAAAGAFTDGCNMSVRLHGRFALRLDPTRAKREAV